MEKQKVEIEDLWRLDKRITKISEKVREIERNSNLIRRSNKKSGVGSDYFFKEFIKMRKIVNDYYSLATCKYVMKNGRELTVYEVLLTLLDRLDRGEYGEFEIKKGTTKVPTR